MRLATLIVCLGGLLFAGCRSRAPERPFDCREQCQPSCGDGLTRLDRRELWSAGMELQNAPGKPETVVTDEDGRVVVPSSEVEIRRTGGCK